MRLIASGSVRSISIAVFLTLAASVTFGAAAVDEGPGTVITVAGTGFYGYSGDGGPATAANLNEPYRVAVDGNDNIYIADTFNHRVRKVDASGTISTVAGNGTKGFSGDGGPATSAALNTPMGVAVDNDGNLMIADTNNGRVRRVSSTGTITTFVGGGILTSACLGENVSRTSACGSYVPDVAVASDGSVVYIDEDRVRKVDPAGNVKTIAGKLTPGYSGDGGPGTSATLQDPEGLGVDASGNVFIADTFNWRVRKVSTNGIISTVVGRDPYIEEIPMVVGLDPLGFNEGADAQEVVLHKPNDVAVDDAGRLVVADTTRVLVVGSDNRSRTIAGKGACGGGVYKPGLLIGDEGPSTSACIANAQGVAIQQDRVLIADVENSRIRAVKAFSYDPLFNTSRQSFLGGRVTDPLGRPIPGVRVDDGNQVAYTDSQGRYLLPRESSGIVTVRYTSERTYSAGYLLNFVAPPTTQADWNVTLPYAVSADWVKDGTTNSLNLTSGAPNGGNLGSGSGRSCVQVEQDGAGSVWATYTGNDISGRGQYTANLSSTTSRVTLHIKDCSSQAAMGASYSPYLSYPTTVQPDLPTNAPVILSPTGSPVIAFAASDSSGINPRSAAVRIDGRPSPVARSAGAFQAQLIGLTDGDHNLEISIADNAGNVGKASYRVRVDTSAPSVTEVTPVGIRDSAPTEISAVVMDPDTGVNPAYFQLILSNESASSNLSYTYDAATGRITARLPNTSTGIGSTAMMEGRYWVTLNTASRSGSFTTKSWNFHVKSLL